MSKEEQDRRDTYKAASRKTALRIWVPLILGFIPLIIIYSALGFSGPVAGATVLVYFIMFFVALRLLFRRSLRSERQSISRRPEAIPIGLSRKEHLSEEVQTPTNPTDSDLRFCPHCGFAVSRTLEENCPKCGKSLTS